MDKIKALLCLDFGSVNLAPGVFLIKSMNKIKLQFVVFPDLLKGGTFTIREKTPEKIKAEIIKIVDEIYNGSCIDLIKKINIEL